MNKKWLMVTIVCLLVIVIIGAGGKVYMDKKAEQKEAEKIEVERMSVEALKNTFADIKSVVFEESEYETMTGSYTFFIKMTNQNDKSVSFMYIYDKGNDEIDSAVIENEEVQVDGVTTSKVHVAYSNKEEGEI